MKTVLQAVEKKENQWKNKRAKKEILKRQMNKIKRNGNSGKREFVIWISITHEHSTFFGEVKPFWIKFIKNKSINGYNIRFDILEVNLPLNWMEPISSLLTLNSRFSNKPTKDRDFLSPHLPSFSLLVFINPIHIHPPPIYRQNFLGLFNTKTKLHFPQFEVY